MRGYRSWVRRHADLVSLLEGAASSLTWVLPERFASAELRLEAFHTAVNVLSAVHAGIIASAGEDSDDDGGAADSGGEGEQEEEEEGKGTAGGWAPPAAAPKTPWGLATALDALRQAEVLVELAAARAERGGLLASRYGPLAAVEAAKAALRFALLARAPGGMLLFGGALGVPGAEAAGAAGAGGVEAALAAMERFRDAELRRAAAAAGGAAAGAGGGGLWWDEPPARRHWAAAAAAAAAAGLRRAPPPRPPPPPPRPDADEVALLAGEGLHILRPLVYVAALRRWGADSWRPWVLSLAAELAALRLSAAGAAAGAAPAPAGAPRRRRLPRPGAAAAELARRRALLAFYLLRDPLFSRRVGPALRAATAPRAPLRRVPLVGWAAERAAELALGAQRYYSYTAAS